METLQGTTLQEFNLHEQCGCLGRKVKNGFVWFSTRPLCNLKFGQFTLFNREFKDNSNLNGNVSLVT